MIALKPFYGFGALFATFALLVFGLGSFSRYELKRPLTALTSAIESSSNIVDQCDPKVTTNMHAQLVTYLAIEGYFRPEAFRAIEFALAALGARIGAQPVATIGIGQIAYSTFAKEYGQDQTLTSATTLREWIAVLEDDCNNVRILERIAQKDNALCSANGLPCFISSICLWHTGNRDVCLENTKYQAYVDDVVTTYALQMRMSRHPIRN